MSDPLHPPDVSGAPTATVYGAGVCGLSVAHELAERGFRVVVVEPKAEVTPDHGWGHTLGGMAASQYRSVSRYLAAPENPEVEPHVWHAISSAAGNDPHVSVEFEAAKVELTEGDKKRISEFIEKNPGGKTCFRVIGYATLADGPHSPAERLTLASLRASAVHAHIAATPNLPADRIRVASYADLAEDTTRGATPPPARGFALVVAGDVMLAGEHGYRYFPGFYRHLFDQLRRIPLYDAHGRPTHRTVFDNLQSVYSTSLSNGLEEPHLYDMRPLDSDAAKLRQMQAMLESTGATWIDYQLWSLRQLRYATTCSERRAAECEQISMMDYLHGYDPRTGRRSTRYSQAFERYLRESPKVLSAFDSQEGDARTNMNVSLQLNLPPMRNLEVTNGTLSGPTTETFINPWRDHLIREGVTFLHGGLARLQHGPAGLKVWAAIHEHGEHGCWEEDEKGEVKQVLDNADYVVVATDVVSAERLCSDIPDIGVPGALKGYSGRVHPRTPPGPRRLAEMTGVQFFFRARLGLATGHIYFGDSPWALSSINQQQLWQHRPSLHREGYASVLSVDIGDLDAVGIWCRKPARECNREELAREVWEQIKRSLQRESQGSPYSRDRRVAVQPGEGQLPEPDWYHVDLGLRFERGGLGPVATLDTPLLIPLRSDWECRPPGDPWDPEAPRIEVARRHTRDLWRRAEGGYLVHWDRLVFAGTYMRTFTRITTMEAANESGRHAVNAILGHLEAHPRRDLQVHEVQVESPVDPTPRPPPTPSPRIPMGAAGDLCRIWDPEHHEDDALIPLKEIDRQLFSKGLPHLFEILRLEDHAQILSGINATLPPAVVPTFAQLVEPLVKYAEWLHSLQPSQPNSSGTASEREVLEGLRRMREALERLGGAYGGGRP